MTHDIDKHIGLINDCIAWGKVYDDNFPQDTFKDYRRELKKIRDAMSVNCSAAAYGESQVGKSYLMSSLLSSSSKPFMITGNGREYSFIDEINPSGGSNTQIESTGVITRFTLRNEGPQHSGFVKVKNLNIVDIILLLVDSYYNDIDIDPANAPDKDKVNKELEKISVWDSKKHQQDIITEDDIKDIVDYVKEVIRSKGAAIYNSSFARVVAPVIKNIPIDHWKDLFSILWNKNPEFDRMFETLLEAYRKINFTENILIPFDAVLREKGTLLKVQWLDTVCGVENVELSNDEPTTDVYDTNGNLLARNFPKGELSALTAEITFELPRSIIEDREFLNEMDLLDFPGARSRESYKEQDIKTVIPTILRRGKVAYLFNKYSRSLQISSMLFCHHNHQKNEDRLGDTITTWLEDNIGKTPEERSKVIKRTEGISPLFFVATKFNLDLEKEKSDAPDNPANLERHWERFNTVIPEIFDPNTWLQEWTSSPSGEPLPFRNIYPLRDFYWSGKRGLFLGYSDKGEKSPETAPANYQDFPDYMERLRESFIKNKFIREHFDNPERAWEDVATLNNDGSKAIIRQLNKISKNLDEARKVVYLEKLKKIQGKVKDEMLRRFVPDDIESKNKKIKKSASAIKQDMTRIVGANPMAFGKIIDEFMIGPEQIRNIAYEIIVLQVDTPQDFTKVNFIKACAGIDTNDSTAENIDKLLSYYLIDTEEELNEVLEEQEVTLDAILSKADRTLTTVADVLTKHILDYWKEHLETTAKNLTDIMPHADIITDMLKRLLTRLGIGRIMSDKIGKYIEAFSVEEQPNVIGDYASLTLNNFVSSVGRRYMSETDIKNVEEKAQACRLPVDISSGLADNVQKRQPLVETLKRLDESTMIINNARIDTTVLRELPFWSNYEKWQNSVMIGLLCSSDVSSVDPECNEKVKELIMATESLY